LYINFSAWSSFLQGYSQLALLQLLPKAQMQWLIFSFYAVIGAGTALYLLAVMRCCSHPGDDILHGGR
jgi:hypothetical protein